MSDTASYPTTPPLDVPGGWHSADLLVPLGEISALKGIYDWVVIGGGITGIAAATRLGKIAPDDSVLLVDARPIGWGASGRNSGFLLDLPHKFDLETRDRERLNKIMHLNRFAIDGLREHTEALGIDCDWSDVGKLQGAVKKRGTGMMRGYIEMLDWLGVDHEVYDRDQCDALMGTSHYHAAVFTPGSVLVDPMNMVRGLAVNLPANVTLADDCPVIKFDSANGGYALTLKPSEGETDVIAKKVILATDPYTSQFGALKGRILPTITFASITRPLSKNERARYRGKLNWGLTPADAAGTTLRMTAEGRILIRNHYAAAPKFKATDHDLGFAREAHRKGIDTRWPELENLPITATWGGVVSLSGNHQTYFGEVADGLYASSCYNGVGLTRGWTAGQLLADLANGKDSKQLDYIQDVSGMPNRLPPDPFLSVGANSRLKLAQWQAGAEV
ncbi:NAD(P)/FAD-dependent oxidoreductase [Cognatishimia activa]|uniref:Gamma-glutamylputrescine oxidoreductase n=1 Tax=Cognatishimia activa TaxID=1715691 RepID=A0A0N7MB99_9RHOB|nr:FAD-binding oxidoreductase [Cognatishimia activa]CUI32094.1 Gamma-glutamylputrescine oxidoreductase [Cognatishimia activa]CUK24816.1 Gamma-glutamylputrescine oxidoreductase [Cognatishimia activa]